jgi:hypothetical protein
LGFPKGGYVSKKYQSWEEQIAPLVSNIQTRGYVTFYELMKIGAWKAARPLAYLTLNASEKVEAITAAAIKRAQKGDVAGAIEALGELEGMRSSLKMRSAVLAVALYPDFPVLDRFAYRAIKALFDGLDVPDVPDCEPETYVKYFDRVKSKAAEWGITVKKADERLMKIGRLAEKESITIEEAYTRLL